MFWIKRLHAAKGRLPASTRRGATFSGVPRDRGGLSDQPDGIVSDRPQALPSVVAHADWSIHPGKRWVARAVLAEDGRYRAARPGPAGSLDSFLDELGAEAGDRPSILLGVDFPIGLPAAYAARAGIEDFTALLPRLGQGPWRDFFRVAERQGEVSLARPFFPQRPGSKGEVSKRQLIDGLGLDGSSDLLRVCDRATPRRPAAAALFWTLGAQQVGKAAITGWRDLLIPALAAGRDLKIWPFDGPLYGLMAPGRVVVAETYPGEVYRHFGLAFRAGGKRTQEGRMANGPALIELADSLGLLLDGGLRSDFEGGFGAGARGEDPFDAAVGLLGMLNVLRGGRSPGVPDDPVVQRIEGWILGQTGPVD